LHSIHISESETKINLVYLAEYLWKKDKSGVVSIAAIFGLSVAHLTYGLGIMLNSTLTDNASGAIAIFQGMLLITGFVLLVALEYQALKDLKQIMSRESGRLTN